MPVDTLHLRSPSGAAGFIAQTLSFPTDPAAALPRNPIAGTFNFTVNGNAVGFARMMLEGIPAGSTITSAVFELQASDVWNLPANFHCGLLPRDGKWDEQSISAGFEKDHAIGTRALMRNGAAASIGATGIGATNNRFFIKNNTALGGTLAALEAGQVVIVTSSDTCASVILRMRRSASPAGNVRCRVERCQADDGSNDLPNGIPVATSNDIVATTISVAPTGADTVFTFAVPFAVTAGQRYALIVESDYAPDAVNFVALQMWASLYAGAALAYGFRLAFNAVAYMATSSLPFFFFSDYVTPRFPAFGTLDFVAVPPMNTPGEWVPMWDCTAQLQEWVNDPLYVEDDVIAVQMFPEEFLTATREGTDFRLRITWEPPVTDPWSRVDGDGGQDEWTHPYVRSSFLGDPSEIDYDPSRMDVDPSVCAEAGAWTNQDSQPATAWTKVDT